MRWLRLVLPTTIALSLGLASRAATGEETDALTPARFIDRFEQVNGVHSGFRRNHAKGLGVSGFFESNGNGVRLSTAAVFEPGRNREDGHREREDRSTEAGIVPRAR